MNPEIMAMKVYSTLSMSQEPKPHHHIQSFCHTRDTPFGGVAILLCKEYILYIVSPIDRDGNEYKHY